MPSLRVVAAFSTRLVTLPPSLDAAGRGRGAGQPLALELPHVGNDRPPIRRRDRPAVPGHQPLTVGDDVEDLSVRIIDDLLLVKRGGGYVASLEQNALAVTLGVVARLAIDRVSLTAAIDSFSSTRTGTVATTC